ncbi:MAG: hypothetical protein ACREDP_04515, partial [Bradyrhizobium sp.]
PLGYHGGSYVSFGLERHAESASSGAQAEIGGIFEKDGRILLLRDQGRLRLPTGHTLGEERDEPGSLFAQLHKAEVRAVTSFVYAIVDDRATGRLQVYHRGEILDGPPADSDGAILTPFAEIPFDDLPSKANAIMLRRYVSERQEDRFGVYVGSSEAGKVHSLERAPVPKS